jgi:hypothetical protein
MVRPGYAVLVWVKFRVAKAYGSTHPELRLSPVLKRVEMAMEDTL